MSTRLPIDNVVSRIAAVVVATFCVLPYAAAEVREPQPDGEVRESTTHYYDKGGRARISLKSRTEDRYDVLATEGNREKPAKKAGSNKPSSLAAAAKGSDDFWIYYADVELFSDDDNDGYFYGIDVLFDADTYYEVADVYAALYLSYEGGPWNEYAVTDTFSIFGATSDDEYVVVTELMSGYPTGSYDLLIELYDAYDGAFVADMGPENNPDLAFLPLEDFNRDDPRVGGSHGHGLRHGGGTLDWPTVLMLTIGAVILYRRLPGLGRIANRRLRRRPASRGTHNLAAPGGQGIEIGVERGHHKQRHDGRKGEAADDGARHGEIRRAVAADLGSTDGQRRETGDSRSNRHKNRPQTVAASFDNRSITGYTLLAQVVDTIDKHDPVIHDHADENHDADRGHEREGRIRCGK